MLTFEKNHKLKKKSFIWDINTEKVRPKESEVVSKC